MNDTTATPTFKPKKSVALSGTAAGNTALCSVGRSGNDLHYRGYDILDLANTCEFEEIAYLLVHGKLPTRAELAYKAKLKSLRHARRGEGRAGRTAAVGAPDGRDAHRRVRAGLRGAGEGRPQPPGRARHRRPLMACLGSMLLYWYHFSHNGRASTWKPTTTRSAATSCTCCTARSRRIRG
jgi:2-methylcitrate synthase